MKLVTLALVCSLTACLDAEVTELGNDPVQTKPIGAPDPTELCRKTSSGRSVPTETSGIDNIPRAPIDDDAVEDPCLFEDEDEPDLTPR